ncbi:MAG: inositol monophosphatase family protein [Gammaproteobacteria bacterium]
MNICSDLVTVIRERLPEILDLRDDFKEKDDRSYVSSGDILVQSLVVDHVRKCLPGFELISEEMGPFGERVWDRKGSYVILDPIDGTENFVSGLREWGTGISVFKNGTHQESCIYLPELEDVLVTGMRIRKFRSRIHGLSSSLQKQDLLTISSGYEYRIIGCSMYNTLAAVKGSFSVFENLKGVNCWDILPGLNLALEHGCRVLVDNKPYGGEILFPTKKYKIRIENRQLP